METNGKVAGEQASAATGTGEQTTSSQGGGSNQTAGDRQSASPHNGTSTGTGTGAGVKPQGDSANSAGAQADNVGGTDATGANTGDSTGGGDGGAVTAIIVVFVLIALIATAFAAALYVKKRNQEDDGRGKLHVIANPEYQPPLTSGRLDAAPAMYASAAEMGIFTLAGRGGGGDDGGEADAQMHDASGTGARSDAPAEPLYSADTLPGTAGSAGAPGEIEFMRVASARPGKRGG